MSKKLADIQEVFAKQKYQYTHHAVIRTTNRRISRGEIEQVVKFGEIIEIYPQDKYGPSCLIFGETEAKRPLHVQCSFPPNVKIITAYEPDPQKWENFRARLRKR